MKKILLINPPFNIAKANYDSSISVGLLSIATYLDDKGISVKMIDAARQADFYGLIQKEIYDADFAGLSVMTTQIPAALEISKFIRALNPNCKIIWGGAHPTFFPEQTASHPLVDLVCVSEGESTLHEIISGRALGEINGLVWRGDDGRIVINPPRLPCNLSEMPLFNWDLAGREVLEKLYLIPSLTSRGCPHRCTFCINAILKNKWRARTVSQVLEDLRVIKSKPYFTGKAELSSAGKAELSSAGKAELSSTGKKLRFWDENFFVDINRAKAIIDGMIVNNLIIPWETTVRANYIREGMIDDKFMAALARSGCYLLSFGAESGSPRILAKIQKDISDEEILQSARVCLKYNIIPQYSFMIGLPGETKKDMRLTLRLIDKLVRLDPRVQILGPQAFRPYPGSPLYEECLAAGWRAPQSLEAWSNLIKDELSYLTVKNFPWVRDKDFVESMEAYVRFGAHSIESAMGSSVRAQKLLKLGFILLCKLRWKLKFFIWPIEFKLAKKYVAGLNQ